MVFGSDLRCSLDRRSMLGMGVVVAVSGVLSGCSGSTESADSSASASQPATPSGGSASSAAASPTVPEWRPASELSVAPDLPSRGVKQTSPSGKSASMYGMTLTLPEVAVSEEQTNQQGLPVTTIRLAGPQEDLPNFVVTYIKEAGKTLDDETHLQEALLLGPGRTDTYVMRTPEKWMMGQKEVPACLMTWTHREQGRDGSTIERDNAALWITNDSGGYWRIIAHAPVGQLKEGGSTWQAMLSAKVDKA